MILMMIAKPLILYIYQAILSVEVDSNHISLVSNLGPLAYYGSTLPLNYAPHLNPILNINVGTVYSPVWLWSVL